AHTDALSDYDVILVVRDICPLVADHAWLGDFGDVLVAFWDPIHPDPIFGIDQSGNVVQYADGLKIDFTLWPEAMLDRIAVAARLPEELDAGYRVLLDKDGAAALLAPPTYAAYVPQCPTEAAYQTWVNDFLTDPPYVAKCLWRDELLPAKWCLDHDMKYVYLRQMLEWWVGSDEGWSRPVGSLGKGLKKRLPGRIWVQLEETYVGAELQEQWEALERTMALFREVAVEVGDRLGYSYPHDLHRRVQAYVEQIRRMPPTR
ncbi:MAG: hypothetical protein RLZZ387_5010, partial [Chloroflexota bacterium]